MGLNIRTETLETYINTMMGQKYSELQEDILRDFGWRQLQAQTATWIFLLLWSDSSLLLEIRWWLYYLQYGLFYKVEIQDRIAPGAQIIHHWKARNSPQMKRHFSRNVIFRCSIWVHKQKFIKLSNLRSVHFICLIECILYLSFSNKQIEEKNLEINTCSHFKLTIWVCRKSYLDVH